MRALDEGGRRHTLERGCGATSSSPVTRSHRAVRCFLDAFYDTSPQGMLSLSHDHPFFNLKRAPTRRKWGGQIHFTITRGCLTISNFLYLYLPIYDCVSDKSNF